MYHNERYGFWALSRFDDVLSASLDAATFSSAYGVTLDAIPHTFEPPPMIMMDPPEHDGMRKLVNRAFTPRRLAQLEDRVHELCAIYLDPWRGSDGFDYVVEFGARLPVMMISSMLGFPESEHDQLRIWSDRVLEREEGRTTPTDAGLAAMASLHDYYGQKVRERRADPVDDIVSDLIAGELVEPDGSRRHLEDDEISAFLTLLNLAGNETVARLLGWAAVTLAEWPAERARLVADPSLIPGAVEELLRFEAPSPIQGRYTVRPATYHGVTVPDGSVVALLTGAAGRDERAFPEPDRFDVARTMDRHLTFGYGAHFCVGAALARLESRVALAETLRRWPEWQCRRDDLELVHTNTVRGPSRAPITF